MKEKKELPEEVKAECEIVFDLYTPETKLKKELVVKMALEFHKYEFVMRYYFMALWLRFVDPVISEKYTKLKEMYLGSRPDVSAECYFGIEGQWEFRKRESEGLAQVDSIIDHIARTEGKSPL